MQLKVDLFLIDPLASFAALSGEPQAGDEDSRLVARPPTPAKVTVQWLQEGRNLGKRGVKESELMVRAGER